MNNPKESLREAKTLLYGKDNTFPDRIVENDTIKVGSKNVANAINRFYIAKIKKITNQMPEQIQDPMINYKKFVKSPRNKLRIQEISMENLRNIYSKINKSNSILYDKISTKTLNNLKLSTQPIFSKFN